MNKAMNNSHLFFFFYNYVVGEKTKTNFEKKNQVTRSRELEIDTSPSASNNAFC